MAVASMHLGVWSWSRQSPELQTQCQNGKKTWLKKFWAWHGCWCQMANWFKLIEQQLWLKITTCYNWGMQKSISEANPEILWWLLPAG